MINFGGGEGCEQTSEKLHSNTYSLLAVRVYDVKISTPESIIILGGGHSPFIV